MKLIIEDDEGRRTVVPVVRDEITIGRTEQNLIRLPEKDVSRRHGRLVCQNGHYFIEDLHSFTGIRVNGERVDGRRQLQDGDLIQISEYDLILEAAPAETASDAKAPVPAPAPVEPPRKLEETATIRVSDLKPEPQAAPEPIAPEQQPRLIGISGKYRGEELVLDRSPIRLGRSDENDLQIDHPSISRNHLRLRRDEGSWKVVDAESRNGVRVNGEPYARIALRHGDVLEIGHLRFAFVEPGRGFALPPEHAKVASGPKIPASQSRTGMWIATGIGSVAAIAAVIALVLHAHAETEAAERVQAARTAALRLARDSVAAHRYGDALQAAEAARRAGAGAAELSALGDLEKEARGEEIYRELQAAAGAQDFERARKLLAALAGTDTHYSAKAATQAQSITAGYVSSHVKAAADLKGKDNAACLTEAQLALAADPQHPQARSLVEECNAPSVRAASVGPSRHPPRPSRPAVRNDAEARRLLEEANRKLVAQDLSGAVATYQKALTLQPTGPILGGIYRGMGIAFTRQGNIEEGAHYYRLYLPLCTNAAERTQLRKVLDDYDARRR